METSVFSEHGGNHHQIILVDGFAFAEELIKYLRETGQLVSYHGEHGLTTIEVRHIYCIRGHEFTPENTYTKPDSTVKECRTCRLMLQRKRLGRDPYGKDL